MSTNNSEGTYDVVIMGGGPSGSSVAALLARDRGLKVLILERDAFPRRHIGESLIPETYWSMKRLGVLEKIKAAGFTKKFSVQFASQEGRYSKPFYFFETNHHESAVTFQVTRPEFDVILIDHAAECGAEVRHGAQVTDVIFEGDRAVGVRYKQTGGQASGAGSGDSDDSGVGVQTHSVRAKVIVDATGLDAFISTKLRLRKRDPKLRKASIYGYFKGARRDSSVDAGATLILRTPQGDGWFWFLPLPDGVTSVGIVADPKHLLRGRGRDYAKILTEEIEACPAARERLADAEREGEVYTEQDFSYRSKQMAGPGWVLVGDAYGFLDPVYSSGIFLALKSAELAADAIADAFEHDDFSAARLGSPEPLIKQGIESFRKLVYAYYTEGFSFGKFMMKHPQYRENLIDLLVGNIFRPGVDDIFDPMKEFCQIPDPVNWGDEPEPGAEPEASAHYEETAKP